MKKWGFIFFLVRVVFADAQQPPRCFSIGTHKNGICFGNSFFPYNGIKLNIYDNSFCGDLNGLYVGGLQRGSNNGLSINLLGFDGYNLNGFTFGLFFIDGKKKINGLALTSISLITKKLNGVAFGIVSNVDTLNGFILSPFYFKGDEKIITKSNGVVFSAYSSIDKLNGVSVAAIYNKIDLCNGVLIGFINKTQELHGLQIGLWNVALNNPKIFRRMPFINFHL